MAQQFVLNELEDWRRSKYLGDIQPDDYGTELNITGWIQDTRKLGAISFIILRDYTDTIQITAIKEEMDDEMFETISNLPRESVIGVKALIRGSDQVRKGYEAVPSELKIFSVARTPLPLGVVDKVFADMDTRLDNRFLDLRKHSVHAIFSIRNAIVKATRLALEEERFIEINTPKIVATATEGGTDLFPMKYFEKETYLNQSPQLYKQMMMSAGFDKVYEIGPAFRAEKHNTVRHINEFISIDIEMSFANDDDVMGVLERVIARAYQKIHDEHQDDIVLVNEFLKQYNKKMEIDNNKIKSENKKIKMENKQLKKQGKPKNPLIPLKDKVIPIEIIVPEVPFPKITYDEAHEIICAGIEDWNRKNPHAPKDIVEYGEDFSMEATKILAQKYPGLYFITKWPMAIKPFYIQPYEKDPKLSRGFDLMFGEKEITSGGQRVHNPDLLISRIKEQGLDPENFKFYLDAFYYGMPPHAGWGLGLERLAMILTGVYNIRETILFPRDRNRVIP